MQKTKQHRAQIQLRDINWEQDFHSLLQIEKQSFARPWSAQQFARFANSHDSRGLIAVQNGTVVGYLLYETSMALNHIAHIAVAPGHRSQGIGSTMIFALKDANPCHALSLNVRRSNVQAQRLYESLNFAHVRTNSQHYADGEDAFVMQCEAVQVRVVPLPSDIAPWTFTDSWLKSSTHLCPVVTPVT